MTKTKVCFKCGVRKDRSYFYAHPMMKDGLLGKCKACAKRDVQENRVARIEQYREYERVRFRDPERKAKIAEYQRRRRAKFPGKNRARAKLGNAVRDGLISKLPCEVCGSPDSEAHHADYRKPLEVKWLCCVHHRESHGQKPKK